MISKNFRLLCGSSRRCGLSIDLDDRFDLTVTIDDPNTMKTMLLFFSLFFALSSLAAEPPKQPGAGATALQWAEYQNAVAAWNQAQQAEAAAARQVQAREVASLQAVQDAAYRAALARQQAQVEAVAAQRRQEQYLLRLLELQAAARQRP